MNQHINQHDITKALITQTTQPSRRGAAGAGWPRHFMACAAMLCCLISQNVLADMHYAVAMQPSIAGTLYVPGNIASEEASFLVDTGASMATISEALYKKLRGTDQITHVRQVAARFASSRIQTIEVYEVANFKVGDCELGPIEVGVIKGGKRNILGLSALSVAAPFSIGMSPPTLSLSHCKGFPTLAVN